jgi:LysM repeat protein
MTDRNWPPTGPHLPGGPRRPGGPPKEPGETAEHHRPPRSGGAAPWDRLPKARHHRRPQPIAVTPAVEALLRRTRLVSAGVAAGPPREQFRVAGVPILIAAVVAGGPGWTTYLVRDGDSLSTIARRHGTDAHALARVNGMSDADRLQAGRRLSVPVPPTNSSQARRRAAASGLHPVDTSGAPALSYRVRDGDTVSSIAARSGSSVRAVLAANNLRPTGIVRPGQLLVLPSLSPAPQPRTTRTPRPAARPVVHVVRPGDTVLAIALRYRIPQSAMLRANRLPDADLIRPGQKLVLPGAQPRPARPVGTTSAHVVRRGETVTAIARRYGVSVNAVLAVNHLQSRTVIHPGRRLLVPVPASGSVVQRNRRARADPPSTFLGRTYPDAVVRAAAANRAALARGPASDRAQVRDLIRRTAHRYRVDPALALAVASMESGFDQRQVSPANAIGVMQVLPSSGVWAGDVIDRRLDLLVTEDNITAGVVLLSILTRQTDEQTALAGYYQGLSSVHRHGMFADTRRYVATVRTLKLRFR